MATLKLSKTASKAAPAKRRAKPDEVPSASVGRRARAGLFAKKPAADVNDAPAPKAARAQTPNAPRAPRAPGAADPDTRTPRDQKSKARQAAPRGNDGKKEFVRGPAVTAPVLEHPPGSIRLSKRMSELGLASRREADEWIERGWVRVDGVAVTELGSRVLPNQSVTIDKRATREQAERVTVLLNKPVGYVSGQAEDGHQPAIKLLLPDNRWADDPVTWRFKREHLRNLAPAGRLDIDSIGLLVFTQDGRIAKELVGENSDVEKEYLVRVRYPRGRLPAEKLALLNEGLELDGVPLRPARVEWQDEDQLRFVLQEGRKRQIRRMCEAVGLEVLRLMRVRIGKVKLGKLPAGQWRYLGEDESF